MLNAIVSSSQQIWFATKTLRPANQDGDGDDDGLGSTERALIEQIFGDLLGF